MLTERLELARVTDQLAQVAATGRLRAEPIALVTAMSRVPIAVEIGMVSGEARRDTTDRAHEPQVTVVPLARSLVVAAVVAVEPEGHADEERT
ncbi:MAG TPA: hypothetical protein VE779_07710 [Candidatus Angelobacter sp.]|nr:hypothetical protein [Candidatus Angelobacter sp.]